MAWNETVYALRRNWPIKRTLLAGGAVAFCATLAALFLPRWTAVIPVAIFLLLWLPPLRQAHRLLLAGICAGFWLSCVGYQVLQVLPLERQSGQVDTLSGWVEAVNETSCTVCITQAGKVPAGTRIQLYTTDLCAPRLHETLTAEVTLSSLPSTSSLRSQGVFLAAYPTGYEENAITITGVKTDLPLTHSIRQLRQPLLQQLRRILPGEEGDVLAAMCVGERRLLSYELQDAYRLAGITHLLVISGLHLSILTGAVSALLRRIGLSRRFAAGVTLPLLGLFMLLVGLSPSVIRAGTMCGVWLVGKLLFCRSNGLNSLGLAAMLLLGYNPYTAVNLSFLLSFLATAGVLCLVPRLLAAQRSHTAEGSWLKRIGITLRDYIHAGLAVCCGGTLLTAPLACYSFGGFPLITPIANLLAVPVSTGALLCGWAGMLLSCVPVVSAVGNALLVAAGLLIKIAIGVARLGSRFPLYLTTSQSWQLALAAGFCVIVFICLLRCDRKWQRRMLGALLVLSLLAGCIYGALPYTAPMITACAAGSGVALLLEHRGHALLLVTHGDGIPDAEALVQKSGCHRLDCLLIGEATSPNAGYLADLLRQVRVERVYSAAPPVWATGVAAQVLPFAPETTLSVSNIRVYTDAAHWQLQVGSIRITLCNQAHSHDTQTRWNIPAGSVLKKRLSVAGDWSVVLCQ